MMRNANTWNKSPEPFRDAALSCLDDAYTLAHFLMRNQADAEAAVEECYRRARHQFEGFRGTAIRPWLLSILRTVCHARLGWRETPVPVRKAAPQKSLRQEPQPAPGPVAHEPQRMPSIRQLVDVLPAPLGETIVLRECNGMSYREIAEATGVPVATVMSRIAQARTLLVAARRAANSVPAQTARPDARGSTPSILSLNAHAAEAPPRLRCGRRD